jgi:pimeloyl-ACP methyl ester carboxylesterase
MDVQATKPPSPTEEPAMTETHTLQLPDVDLVYDVHGPIPTVDGRPLLFMIGQPMQADGFADLAAQFPDRTVVTYDPRGLGRSNVRRDGRNDQTPQDQADDLHALAQQLGQGRVDVFGSSGGAVAGLTWVERHPDDIATLLAHEPPSTWALPDADNADRAFRTVRSAYADRGFGAGMAQFIAVTMWPGEFTEAFFEQPPADPAMFGLPTDDDGGRDDMLLSERAVTVTRYEYDADAIRSSGTRVVLGIGEETGDTITARTSSGVADRLGAEVVMFPSHHGGFVGGGPENPYAGKPEEFGVVLHRVLDLS